MAQPQENSRISHSRDDESPAAKAKWFQSLSVEERMAHFVEMSELVLSLRPDLIEKKSAEPIPGRVRVLTSKRS